METEQEKYQRALARVQSVRKFYSKIIKASVVCAIVAGINFYVNEFRNPWVLWVVGFSLLGIIIDGTKLYGMSLFLGRGWEQRKIREEMQKDTNSSNPLIKK